MTGVLLGQKSIALCQHSQAEYAIHGGEIAAQVTYRIAAWNVAICQGSLKCDEIDSCQVRTGNHRDFSPLIRSGGEF